MSVRAENSQMKTYVETAQGSRPLQNPAKNTNVKWDVITKILTTKGWCRMSPESPGMTMALGEFEPTTAIIRCRRIR